MPIQINSDLPFLSNYPVRNILKNSAPPTNGDQPNGKVDSFVSRHTVTAQLYSVSGAFQFQDDDGESLLVQYQKTRVTITEQVSYFQAKMDKPVDEAEAPTSAFESLAEYWNKENTASRIVSIALLGYAEGADRDEFADKAINMVKQAYTDVQNAFGTEFPQLVKATKAAALSALNQFKNGADISELSYE